jgi:serine-aspartate repeat-containing protein C/D/E
MSTMTIRVTSSATNTQGTDWGQQTDLLTPSYFDMVVTGSSNSSLPNGTYDAYCLNPFLAINLSPNSYSAIAVAGNTNNVDSYTQAGAVDGTGVITSQQIQQLNWLVAQNFTSDSKYEGQFNFGEVQAAIWQILGYTPAQYNTGITPRLLSDNNRQEVKQEDVDLLVTQSLTAVSSGINVLPSDAYFSMLVDPAGNVQPLIVQLKSGKLGNFVWEDSNGNGIQDLGELGVNNVIVELYDGDGNFISSTVTGDDYSTAAIETGYYQFTGLAAGQYQVKFFTPEGMLLTAANVNSDSQDTVDSDAVVDSDGNGLSQIITLPAGESNQTIDAGIYKTATIGNFIWHDINKDGIQNAGEVGIEGVTVTLTGTTGAGQSVSLTIATNANGEYLFTDLAPGTYKVTIDASNFLPNGALEGYIPTLENEGGNTAIDSNNPDDSITLQSGDENLTVDYGFYKSEDVEPPKASLGNFVWHDVNANGIQDNGEAGIPGATVNLLVNGVVVDTTTTNDDGLYSFTNLTPGVGYQVQFVTPDGFTESSPVDVGNDALDSDGLLTGVVTLAPGENNQTLDSGFYNLASIGDKVFADNNGNGIQDDGEAGVAGVTVKLFTCVNGQPGTQVGAAIQTDANGNYSFTGLQPGDYVVQFIALDGTVLSTANVGNDDWSTATPA